MIFYLFKFWLLIVCLWRYEEDVWSEIAKFLDGRSLMKLAVTSKWFQRVIMDDSIWKFVCLRDLQLPASPQHVDFKWFDLYTSAFGMYKNFTLPWPLYSACFPRLYHQLFFDFADGSHSFKFHQKEKHIGEFDSSSILDLKEVHLPKHLK